MMQSPPHPTAGPARRRILAAAAAAGILALAACGSGSGSTSTGGGAGTTAIKVGVIPIVDVAPIYLGKEKGFFKDVGLDLTLQTAQGGAAIVPGVVSGQYQFGFSNTISLLLAASKNLPLKVVANGVAATKDPLKDYGGVVVKADSPINSAKDLAGKRIAVNTLNNINTTTINELVRADGGDPSGIKYVELAFPDTAPAIAKGDVDAGQVVEPFLTIAKDQGDRFVASNYAGIMPELTVAMYFTSQTYAASNPKVVESFALAMKKSLAYANNHPDEARKVLSTYTKIDPKVAAAVTLPGWPEAINKDSVQKLSDLAVKDKLLTTAPDLTKLLP